MSYTVLARKWRPKNFAELVGQSHVMQALSNALDQNRLHHAYLFTGTRGVGKTTIARIFSKALNCQQGISSTPCGVCETCRAIDEGRFIDLIEVDAASRTKVDDTREILDNVQFAPTQGRYKVYLIDEVHMLSKSSFNALLKTLEEPPEHVKFLLATTDPHKLPITVLSRCLQFNLMRLTQTQIQGHLEHILQQEAIPFESSALALIAKSADGSARDALSLLDQAIAYGAGEIHFEPVQTMLGLVDQQYTVAILEALAADSPEQIKSLIQQLAAMGVDYAALLAQLIETLHALSYNQVLGGMSESSLLPEEVIASLSHALPAERVQLLYQVALLAKQDMQLAPDIRIGFEMALMRMLAFQPADTVTSSETPAPTQTAVSRPSTQAATSALQAVASSAPEPQLQEQDPQTVLAGLSSARALMAKAAPQPEAPASKQSEQPPASENIASVQTPPSEPPSMAAATAEQIEPVVAPAAAPLMEDAPPWDIGEAVTQPQQSQPSPQAAAEQAVSSAPVQSAGDHLSQIKQRLKQPLGKQPERVESAQSEAFSANQQMQPAVQSAEKIEVVSAPQSVVEPVSTTALSPSVAERLQMSSQPEASVEAPQVQGNVALEVDKAIEENSWHNPAEQPQSWEYVALTDDNRLQVWLSALEKIRPEGMAAELTRQSVLVDYSPEVWRLSVDPQQAYAKSDMAVLRLKEVLQQFLGSQVQLEFVEFHCHDTPLKYEQQVAADKQAQAEASIQSDPLVNQLKSELGFEVIQSSISPL